MWTNRQTIYSLLLVIVIASGFLWFSKDKNADEPPAPLHVTQIHVTDTGYEPSNVTIQKGTTLEFINNASFEIWPASDLHPTHGIYPEFDPREPVSPGQSWSFTFDKVGEWKYHDHLKPNRRGIVRVID